VPSPDSPPDWNARYSAAGFRYDTVPNPWLSAHADLLTAPGVAIDLACGEGRDALFLARLGYRVTAIDTSAVALAKAAQLADRHGIRIEWRRLDLEEDYQPPAATFDVVTCHNFLHRPLLASLPPALRPGGLLIYATFLEGQEIYGRPANPAHLLHHGELARTCADLEILDQQQGLTTYRGEAAYRAAIVARRPASRMAGDASYP